jgi:hypothetical protein
MEWPSIGTTASDRQWAAGIDFRADLVTVPRGHIISIIMARHLRITTKVAIAEGVTSLVIPAGVRRDTTWHRFASIKRAGRAISIDFDRRTIATGPLPRRAAATIGAAKWNLGRVS